jgi:D-alanyl-D-alanine carboxypeptidase/D-alanyl-D-alanine-endopeptidase (penicillin-binding protein 4)
VGANIWGKLVLHYPKHNIAKKFLLLGLLINASFGLNITVPSILKPNLSVSILDADTAKPIYNYNDTTPRLIASNVKLFTSIFGLSYLGPDFHWHTQLKYSGKIRDHILYGNVYLHGGGDPTLNTAAIYDIISKLKNLGINTIQGNIILDSSLFNNSPTYSMLQTNQYDADKILPSGLIINENRANFTVHLNGDNINISHNLYNIKVVNRLSLSRSATACDIDDSISMKFHNNVATLNGSISPACDNVSTSFLLLSNFNYNKMIVAQVLKDFEIRLNGEFENAQTPNNAKLIYEHSSQTLAHMLYDMNKTSNNLYAETIISSMGAYKTKNQETFNDGAKIYYKFLQNNDLLNPKFKLENGAGLSRYEFFTASEVAHLLYIVNGSPIIGPLLEASLPVTSGEGSLHNKFNNFSGRLMAKTGTLNDTRAYSGYFYNKSGNKYIVVFIANNLQNQEQKAAVVSFIEQVLGWLDNLD